MTTKMATDDKKLFLVASSDPKRIELLAQVINKHVAMATVFKATDANEALFKMGNIPPHIFITDVQAGKLSGIELASKVLAQPSLENTSIIIVSPIPDQEHFVDQVVKGQVQFLTNINDESAVSSCINKALSRVSDDKSMAYRLRQLANGEILFREGDEAKTVFIVKRGEMQAYKGEGKILGNILAGEFVGEMAHFNGGPRSATVKALTDCELIEIPMGALDTVLFSKPAWSKALIATLSKRLKRTIESA